jgi:hypothetical protein
MFKINKYYQIVKLKLSLKWITGTEFAIDKHSLFPTRPNYM